MSLRSWPTLHVLGSLGIVWLAVRLFAGRTVLPARRFVRFFVLGMVGGGIGSLILQRIAAIWVSQDTSAWTLGPAIEELLKVGPVLLLVLVLRDGRRLAIGDVVLAAFTTGLGFEFFETNLFVLRDGVPPPWKAQVWFLNPGFGVASDWSYFVGHAFTAALIGLAAVIGLRLGGRRLAIAAAGAAFAISTFEHMLYNWKILTAEVGALGIDATRPAWGWVETLRDIDLHGRLGFFLLAAGLPVAVWVEGRRCGRLLAARPDLVLADEWVRPTTAVEWVVEVQRLPAGRRIATGTAAFFRQRRALALAMLEERGEEPGVLDYRAHLNERLAHRLEELRVPSDGRWLPAPSIARRVILRVARRLAPMLVALVLFAVIFSISLNSLGRNASRVYGTAFSTLVIVAGLAFAIRRIMAFARRARPDRMRTDGDAFVGYHAQAYALACSVCSGAIGLLGLRSAGAIVAGAANAANAGGLFSAAGGGLAAVAGLGSWLASATPDAPEPCQTLSDEADAADADLAALDTEAERALADATGSYDRAIADGMDPSELGPHGIVTLGTMPPPKLSGSDLGLRPVARDAAPTGAARPAASHDGDEVRHADADGLSGDGSMILAMGDGVRLRVPVSMPPARSFGATRGPVAELVAMPMETPLVAAVAAGAPVPDARPGVARDDIGETMPSPTPTPAYGPSTATPARPLLLEAEPSVPSPATGGTRVPPPREDGRELPESPTTPATKARRPLRRGGHRHG